MQVAAAVHVLPAARLIHYITAPAERAGAVFHISLSFISTPTKKAFLF
jgi:hypothetical protein